MVSTNIRWFALSGLAVGGIWITAYRYLLKEGARLEEEQFTPKPVVRREPRPPNPAFNHPELDRKTSLAYWSSRRLGDEPSASIQWDEHTSLIQGSYLYRPCITGIVVEASIHVAEVDTNCPNAAVNKLLWLIVKAGDIHINVIQGNPRFKGQETTSAYMAYTCVWVRNTALVREGERFAHMVLDEIIDQRSRRQRRPE